MNGVAKAAPFFVLHDLVSLKRGRRRMSRCMAGIRISGVRGKTDLILAVHLIILMVI
jgi:hypothetical protein